MIDCPIKEDLEKTTELGGEFSKQMKKIRDELKVCEQCPELKICEARKDLDRMVDRIILEINEEWGL